MYPASVVSSIQGLLAAGVSQAQIARQTGVSRGTVGNIAHGRRLPQRAPAEDGEPYVKCLGCGGMVQMPCRLCARRRAPLPRIYREIPAEETDLNLQLRGRHRERQQAVATQKRLAGEWPVGRVTDDEEIEAPTPEELAAIEREGQ
ncbi:MAG: hypothetical protein ACYTG0_32185 [Planctomycetota bacterium]|jgi:hypothetical protein